MSYGDYAQQLTFLLLQKMADEQAGPPFNKPSPIPKGKDWPALLARDDDKLEIHYRHTLEELGKRSGMLGVIFRKAQNKIQDPANLRRLIVDLISTDEHGLWTDTFTPHLVRFTGDLTARRENPTSKSPRISSCSLAAPGFSSMFAVSLRLGCQL